MKKIIILLFCLVVGATEMLSAQTTSDVELQYKRSSLYSLLISHNKAQFAGEIENVFFDIPIPDKFNNHDLSVKVITSPENKTDEQIITTFLTQNDVAKHVVGRWFNRDPESGVCDMNLISERGLYNASYLDVEMAKMSQRGFGILADAGEQLIGNTFVLVNDIRYNDRSKGARIGGAVAGGILSVLGSLFGLGDVGDLISEGVGAMISSLKGFGVTVTSYLYRLEWNDEVANTFYTQHYLSEGETDTAKRDAFAQSDIFKLTYVGKQSTTSGNLTMASGVDFDPVAMIRKVCARAIDESIIALQRAHDEFKIKTPIHSVEPDITAHIGLKEGVTEGNRYEVLEPRYDKDGKVVFARVGVVQPVKGKIWDNRYMATEEGSAGSKLSATTFRKVTGGKFYPGLLLREIKTK